MVDRVIELRGRGARGAIGVDLNGVQPGEFLVKTAGPAREFASTTGATPANAVKSTDLAATNGASRVGAGVRSQQQKNADLQSVRDFAGVLGNNSDQAAALAAVYANAAVTSPYFPKGQYRIASNLTISKASSFDQGAVIFVASGARLTIAADIKAGQHQVFKVESGGELTITSGALAQIIPDWFGPNEWYGGSNTVYGKRTGEKLVGVDAPTQRNYSALFGYRVAEKTTIVSETALFGTFAGNALADGTFVTGFGYGVFRGKETFEGSGEFRGIDAPNSSGFGCGVMQDGVYYLRCVGFGDTVLKEADRAIDCTFIGAFAGRTAGRLGMSTVGGTNAGYNMGKGAATENDCVHNAGWGYAAFNNATLISYNCAFGSLSGSNLTTGQRNTMIGYNTGPLTVADGALVDAILIGYSARATKDANKTIVIGNNITETRNVTRLGSSADQLSTIFGPAKLEIGDTSPVHILKGTGVPTMAAPMGSLYLRLDGGAGSTLYVKETGGSTNQGWAAK